MEIGQKIKAVRLKLHMSQTEFAQLFGVSFATVNRWENGRTTPNYRAQRTFEQLCKEKIRNAEGGEPGLAQRL